MGISNFRLPKHKINDNYETLIDLVMGKLEDNIDKLLNNNKMRIYFFDGYKTRFISLKMRSNLYIGEDRANGMIIMTPQGNFVINLEEDLSEEQIIISLIHETIHISQTYNHMMDYHFKLLLKDENYYNSYNDHIVEKEATIGEFIYAIRLDDFEFLLWIILNKEVKYYENMDFKKIVKKLYSIGVDKQTINEWREYLADSFYPCLEEYKKIDEEQGVEVYIDYEKIATEISRIFNVTLKK